MENEGVNKNSNSNLQQQDKSIQGRTHNSQNPQVEQTGSDNDISAVDQQEGNMSNGETGGHDFGGKDQ